MLVIVALKYAKCVAEIISSLTFLIERIPIIIKCVRNEKQCQIEVEALKYNMIGLLRSKCYEVKWKMLHKGNKFKIRN